MIRSKSLLVPAVFSFLMAWLAPCWAMQASPENDSFTIAVSAPTTAKEVQVRYLFADERENKQLFAVGSTSVSTPIEENKIVIKTRAQEKPAQSFRAIAYAPGCQFVTISVDDLAQSNRQG